MREMKSRFISSSSFLRSAPFSHLFLLLLIVLSASLQTPSTVFFRRSSLSSSPSLLLVNASSSSQVAEGKKEEDKATGGRSSLRSGQQQTDKPVLLEYKTNGAGGRPPVACAQNLRDAVNGAISEISGQFSS